MNFQRQRVEESSSENTKGFGIEAQILDEVGSDDGIGNPIKHGEGIKSREDSKD
jgi:hypothetical protein